MAASDTTSIRVLVVDDHPMFVSALVRNLEVQPDIEVVASAATIAYDH